MSNFVNLNIDVKSPFTNLYRSLCKNIDKGEISISKKKQKFMDQNIDSDIFQYPDCFCLVYNKIPGISTKEHVSN